MPITFDPRLIREQETKDMFRLWLKGCNSENDNPLNFLSNIKRVVQTEINLAVQILKDEGGMDIFVKLIKNEDHKLEKVNDLCAGYCRNNYSGNIAIGIGGLIATFHTIHDSIKRESLEIISCILHKGAEEAIESLIYHDHEVITTLINVLNSDTSITNKIYSLYSLQNIVYISDHTRYLVLNQGILNPFLKLCQQDYHGESTRVILDFIRSTSGLITNLCYDDGLNNKQIDKLTACISALLFKYINILLNVHDQIANEDESSDANVAVAIQAVCFSDLNAFVRKLNKYDFLSNGFVQLLGSNNTYTVLTMINTLHDMLERRRDFMYPLIKKGGLLPAFESILSKYPNQEDICAQTISLIQMITEGPKELTFLVIKQTTILPQLIKLLTDPRWYISSSAFSALFIAIEMCDKDVTSYLVKKGIIAGFGDFVRNNFIGKVYDISKYESLNNALSLIMYMIDVNIEYATQLSIFGVVDFLDHIKSMERAPSEMKIMAIDMIKQYFP